MPDREILLKLEPWQEAHLLREALATRAGLSPLNDALSDLRLAAARRNDGAIRGGRARMLLRAMLALMAFPSDGSPLRVKDATETVQMRPSEVLREAVAWTELGVLVPLPASREYKRVRFLVA